MTLLPSNAIFAPRPTDDTTPIIEVLPPERPAEHGLTWADLEGLGKSSITPELADRAGLYRVDDVTGREIVGYRGSGDCSGIVIPNILPGETRPRENRIRRDHPDVEYDAVTGKAKEKNRYLSPPGRGNLAYFPPGTPFAWLADPSIPVCIVEGEKKALALRWLLDLARVYALVIGLPGVWNWRGTIGKSTGPGGDRRDVKGVIPDIERIAWQGRKGVVIFDSNVNSNALVLAARLQLSQELKRRGAEVYWVDIPERPGINGIDDLLGQDGPGPVLALLSQPKQFEEHARVRQYQATPSGLQRVVKKDESDEESVQPLANFTATIVGQVVMDDGVDETRDFLIEAWLRGRKVQLRVPASEFDAMAWVAEQVGAEAVIFVGRSTKDHVRTAIRLLSGDIPESRIYSHTGWREFGEAGWGYLHTGGAIGAHGCIPGISVQLPRPLALYELPEPPDGDRLVDAVRSSLSLLSLTPDPISFVLFCAVYRAPLGNTDLSVFVAGHTGLGKSEKAALCQQHYGAGMDRKHLPSNWASTSNANESLAHSAKDAILVVDDFVPQGNSHDVARTHKDADRLLRGQGNQAGRGRLRADGSHNPGRQPRGLIISTGEDVPRGQSLAARMVVANIGPGDVNWEQMTQAQQDARDGLFAAAMAGYVQYLAARFGAIRRGLSKQIEQLRKDAAAGTAHKHTPENIANLAVGLEYFLDYAVHAGAVSVAERTALWERGWRALLAAGGAQKLHQLTNDPSEQFLSFIRMALTSGKAHFAPVAGGAPPNPAAWGWRERLGGWYSEGDLIGWVDGKDVYLQPEATYRLAQIIARDSNASFGLTDTQLWRRLKEKGLLASTEEKRQTFKVRKTINGTCEKVLHMLAATIRPVEEVEPDNVVGYPTSPPTTATAESEGFESEMSGLSGSLNSNTPPAQEELFG
jgi:hypothetical protein